MSVTQSPSPKTSTGRLFRDNRKELPKILFRVITAMAVGMLAFAVLDALTTPRIRLCLDPVVPFRPCAMVVRLENGDLLQTSARPFFDADGIGRVAYRLPDRPMAAIAFILPEGLSPTRICRLQTGTASAMVDQPVAWLTPSREADPSSIDPKPVHAVVWSGQSELIQSIVATRLQWRSLRRWSAIGGVVLCGLVFLWLPLVPIGARRFHRPATDELPTMGLWSWPMMLAVLAAAAMAALSPWNAHPDEVHHVQAAVYYYDHWIPPHIDSLRGGWYFSKYGASYLFDPDITYFLAGKWGALLKQAGVPPIMAFRWFNAVLLAVLAGLYWRSHRFSHLAVVLISPQIWYLFAYANNDAFPLFIGLVALGYSRPVRTVIPPSGPEPHHINHDRATIFWGLGIALLLLCKRNYLPLYLFFVTTGGMAAFKASRPKPGGRLVRYSAATGIGLLLAATVWLGHSAQHHWQTSATIDSVMAAEAQTAYSKAPTVVGHDTVPWVRLRSKGTPLYQVFTRWNWHGYTFKSFFGVYGWMQYYAPGWVYGGMMILCMTAGLIAVRALARHPPIPWPHLITVIGFAVMLTMAAIGHSWINDFQPQGRYLFPVLVMAASMRPDLRSDAASSMRYCLGLMFLLSMVSFAWVAIGNLC